LQNGNAFFRRKKDIAKTPFTDDSSFTNRVKERERRKRENAHVPHETARKTDHTPIICVNGKGRGEGAWRNRKRL